MAKNTNPLTKSLLIKHNWYSLVLPSSNSTNIVHQDLFISKLIHGSFYKLGILTSQVYLSRSCNKYLTISFYYYPLKLFRSNHSSTFGNLVLPLIKLLKSLLIAKYPGYNIKFVAIKAPHKFIDSKILNDFIHFSVSNDPNRIKFVLYRLIKEFKFLSTKKFNLN